jgi:membrane associated rhomboid family serine protease
VRYLIFYVLGGIIAGLAHILSHPTSPVPTVGASGAIAAVLGAYMVLYPLARVITLVPIPIFFTFPVLEIPAIFYLGFWFLSQLFNGTFALAASTYQEVGVAWWAHVGGFVAGLLLVHVFVVRRAPPRHPARHQYFYPDEYQPW